MKYLDEPFGRSKGAAMKRLMLVVPLILAFSGCAHYYVHPTKKTAEFNRDKRDCEKIAEREAARNRTRPCDEVERCLITTKGWKRD
jgi:hypothetical protein